MIASPSSHRTSLSATWRWSGEHAKRSNAGAAAYLKLELMFLSLPASARRPGSFVAPRLGSFCINNKSVAMDSEKHHHWYGKQRWRNRAKLQMKLEPLCRMCLSQGVTEPATTADHIVPHRGDEMMFWFGALQSLCTPHHSRSKQQLEVRGYTNEIGIDGWPIDQGHPVHKNGPGGTYPIVYNGVAPSGP
jgi:5-methylcytosine-specific restriction protein A